MEDETLPRLAHHLGRLCYELMRNMNLDQKAWFTSLYKQLASLGVDGKTEMPDLVPPIEDKSELYSEVRRESAYNFPAMVIFVGPRYDFYNYGFVINKAFLKATMNLKI